VLDLIVRLPEQAAVWAREWLRLVREFELPVGFELLGSLWRPWDSF
jgi:hypothetical protein